MESIDGVSIIQLRRIPDERGTVHHMLKATDPHFQQFGEIYFSTIYNGVVKGWHYHHEMTLNYACIFGRIKVVLFDDRDKSPTHGQIQEIFIGPENYALVIIPPRVWNGVKGYFAPHSIIANCATIPHRPDEIVRLDPFTERIPYNWDLKHG